MKINQVEELVGITKKNIRFYEEQGLIRPERNRDNGYREYSMEDVQLLNKIKLLRRLDVPLEEIRKLESGEVSLKDCLDRHISHFSRRQRELDIMKEMCRQMMGSDEAFGSLQAENYLEDMKDLEKGGIRFMDLKQTDVKKSKRAPIIISVVSILFLMAMIALTAYTRTIDPSEPLAVVIIAALLFGAMIIGVILALKQRLKEIDGGEINEASKY
ncbi:MAG: MerR family transcriptional regulator [Lachnospiraceae bacterium]|nr:MerR family transcriptional regulator [Lachnospiraceae bacterium]